MEKLLTIAIPTFNRKHYLGIALESIFSQYDDRIEVIVSDNCSTDGTGTFVCENYPAVRYLCNEKNIGMENFRRCYDSAVGRYILLLGDDDVFVDGSLSYILNFLEHNEELSVVFMNHSSFTDNYIDLEHCRPPFFDTSCGDFITDSKERFMEKARHQLTFISCCILSREAYHRIDGIEKYSGNYFLQTCVAFECMNNTDSKLGVISKVCVAQNTPGSEQTIYNMKLIMDVFARCEYDVFCRIGVELGQNKKQMRKIYSYSICSTWPKHLIFFKTHKLEWRKPFWSVGFPIAAKFIHSWFTIIPAAIIPAPLLRFAVYLKRRIQK